jgi:hypothetical protein
MAINPIGILIAGALGLIGTSLVWSGLSRKRQMRLIRDTPTSKISTAPLGLAEIQGVAWASGQAQETIGGERAALYHLRIDEVIKMGKYEKLEKRFENSEYSFLVSDDTGALLVDASDAELDVETTEFHSEGMLKEDRARAMRLFSNIEEVDFSGKFFGRKFRAKEVFVRDGSEVYLRGSITSSGKGSSRGTHNIMGTAGSCPERKLYVASQNQEKLLRRLGRFNLARIVAGASIIGYIAFLFAAAYFEKTPGVN